jgi:hypothetical protein
MPRTVILSEETLRALLEANASLAAWYHEFVRASREQTPVQTPGDVTRKAFLDRLATEHPEVAALVSQMGTPSVFVPPPLAFAPTSVVHSQQVHSQQGQAQQGQQQQAQPQGYGAQFGGAPADDAGVAKPGVVNPRLVKY